MILLFSVAAEAIIRLVPSGVDPERISLIVELSRIIIRDLIFHGLSITLVYMLNALYDFVTPRYCRF